MAWVFDGFFRKASTLGIHSTSLPNLLEVQLKEVFRVERISLDFRRRFTAPSDESRKSPQKSKLYRVIRCFLIASILLLGFELLAYWKGWHFSRPNLYITPSLSINGLLESIYSGWLYTRVNYLAPPLQYLANVCIILFLIQSTDRALLCVGCFWIKLKKIKPVPKCELGDAADLEQGDNAAYPMVLVQMPMCNEREKGVHIVYRHRVVRTGYKAGNLKSAMNCDYVKDYEFVAIFDADFRPDPDFLKRTAPHFKDNDELALVQGRWSFVNRDENLLTRLQYINLSFHFEVEQQVNSVFVNIFGFNGTAGVWRIKVLDESGGWLERTTMEDMDIAVRAHLNGWKFIFLDDAKCLCKLPES